MLGVADLPSEQKMRRAAAAAARAAVRHHSLSWLDLSHYFPKHSSDMQRRHTSCFEAALLRIIREETAALSQLPSRLPARAFNLDDKRQTATRAASEVQQPKAEGVDDSSCTIALDSLPHAVRHAFSARGILSLWEWQASLLSNLAIVRDRRNALVCLPAGSGKSVAADLLLLRNVLQMGQSAVLALPYQSAVHEKARAYEAMVLSTELWVAAHDGTSPAPRLPQRPTLCVCTLVLKHPHVPNHPSCSCSGTKKRRL
jgi:hypothetical protein